MTLPDPAANSIALARPTATVLATPGSAGSHCTLLLLTLPPYDPGAPIHCHPDRSEGCYVLSGTLALTQGDRTVMLAPGAAATVPPGVPHTYWNPAAVSTTLLLI